MKNIILKSTLTLLILGLMSGCNSGGASPADKQQDVPSAGVAIADQLDADLEHYLPSGNSTSVDSFYVLKRLCNENGGEFDPSSSECICGLGGLFDTRGDKPGCARLSAEGGQLTHSGNALTFEGVNINAGEIGADWSAAADGAKPFRVSFVGASDIQVGYLNVFSTDKSGAFSSIVRMFRGAPYLEGESAEPFYEPDEKFVLPALGMGVEKLSQDDQKRFSGFVVPELPDSTISQTPGEVFTNAYQSMRALKDFHPSVVFSPYPTGCASYCVAAVSLETGNPDYSASYAKVYQFGTPSTRTIVVRDNVSSNVAGVIVLNAAETVSTITFAHLQEDDQLESPFFQLESFDRYGALVGMDIVSQLDIFSSILQGMGK
jgi:hypothetical protein